MLIDSLYQRSFTDAELRKDPFQDVIGCGFADNLAKAI